MRWPASPLPPASDAAPSVRRSRFGFLGLSHKHTAASATLLLSIFALLSRVIGLIRDKYIAYTFGAGPQTDAYNIAFNLPDLVSYLLIGGAASISFVTILSRYREQGRDDEGEIALSVILNTMVLVLGSALLIAEFLTPLYIRIYSKHDPAQDALAVHMTRILLPGQLFFFAGGVLASVALVRKQFGYQAISPLVYSAGIIFGGVIGARWLGIPSLAWGALIGAFTGPFLVVWRIAARRAGLRWRPVLDLHNPGLREWVRMSIPMMLGVTVVTLDTQILQFFAKHETGDITRLMNAKKLFTAPMAIIGQAAGAASLPFFASLFSANKMEEFRGAIRGDPSRGSRPSHCFWHLRWWLWPVPSATWCCAEATTRAQTPCALQCFSPSSRCRWRCGAHRRFTSVRSMRPDRHCRRWSPEPSSLSCPCLCTGACTPALAQWASRGLPISRSSLTP